MESVYKHEKLLSRRTSNAQIVSLYVVSHLQRPSDSMMPSHSPRLLLFAQHYRSGLRDLRLRSVVDQITCIGQDCIVPSGHTGHAAED